MKINKVKLRNINSLQTSDVIELDFMNSPLADTGLFAIVGDTGAGKTTILDAITLAIYGKVHRNKNEKEVISYGAVDSLAEVEFEANGQLFRSKWNIRRARNKADGKIQAARRELSKWNENKQSFDIIYERIHGYNDLIQEFTGLDYHQFCRSVLLAQGDFAAFLKAEAKERSELLEQITGTEYYTQISQAAYERHDLEAQRLAQIQDQITALDILPEEELKVLELRLEEKSEESKVLQAGIQSTIHQLSWLQQLVQLEQRKKDLESNKIRFQDKFEKLQADFDRLEKHTKILPFQNDLKRLTALAKEKKELENKIEESYNLLQQLEKDRTAKKVRLEEVKSKFEATKKKQSEQEPIFRVVEQLDFKIEEATKRLSKFEKNYQEELEKQKAAQTQSKHLIEQHLRLQKSVATSEMWLSKHQVLQSGEKDLAQLDIYNARINELNEKVEESEQAQLNLGKQLEEQEKKVKIEQQKLNNAQTLLSDLEQELQAYTTKYYKLEYKNRATWLQQASEKFQHMKLYFSKLKQLTNTIQRLEEQEQVLAENKAKSANLREQKGVAKKRLEELKTELQARKRHYEVERAIKNYERDRQQLKAEEACPLCGSKEHPYCDASWNETFVNESKERLENTEKAVEKAQNYWNDLEQQEKSRAAQAEILEQDKIHLEQQIVPVQQEIKALNLSDAPQDFSYKALKNYIASYEKHLEKEEKRQAIIKEIDAKISVQEARKQAAYDERISLQAAMQSATTSFKTQQEQLKNWKKERNDNITIADHVFQKYGFSSAKNRAQQLKELHENYKIFLTKKANLESEVQSEKETKQQIQYLGKQIEERAKNLEQQQTQLLKEQAQFKAIQKERKELLGTENPENLRAELLETLKKAELHFSNTQKLFQQLTEQYVKEESTFQARKEQLESVKKEGKISQENLVNALQKVGLSLKEADASLLSEDEANRLKDIRLQLEDQQKETNSNLKQIAQQIQNEQQKKLTTLTAESLNEKQQQQEQTYRELQQAIGKLKERIQYNDTRKQQSQSLQDQLLVQKKEYARWSKLNDLIGMRSGKKFRVFAQGLTLQQLTYHANQHLQKLDERYFIRRHETEELELEIVDRYQANHLRSMSTLSGGESFLVSLALALGLSDLAGKNVMIRSLFIDEGFGTLDEATLDMAITTLENLQASGKTIGIISHVKALKERISTQIRIHKRGNGYSVVEVVG